MMPAGPRRSSGTSWWNAVLVPSATSSGRVGSPRPTRLIGRRWRTPTMTMRWWRRWSVRAISTYWSPAGGDRHPANPSGSTACTERWSPGRSTGPGSDMDTTIGERLPPPLARPGDGRGPPPQHSGARRGDVDVLALFHFSPPVVSAALATAERVKASGRDFIAAVVAGCEMMARLSEAVNPALRDRGFHTTPSCGGFGAAVAAGRLLSLARAGA